MAASEVASFKMNFFRVAGTLVSEKAECLLAIGEDKKKKLLGLASTFNMSSSFWFPQPVNTPKLGIFSTAVILSLPTLSVSNQFAQQCKVQQWQDDLIYSMIIK